jgi:RNA polymerase sigma-70 factor, ECF subfamily
MTRSMRPATTRSSEATRDGWMARARGDQMASMAQLEGPALPPPEPTVTAAVAPSVSPQGFDAFYRAESGGVLAVVAALTGNRAVAEELTQEAFATAHRKWSKISRYDQPGVWVRRVAINRAISSIRTRQAESRALDRMRNLPAQAPTATLHVDDELWRAIRSLPAKQAQAVVLTYVEDLPPARVAEILGCREGTVKSHLNRARRTLAQRLGPRDATPPESEPTR